MGSRQKKASHPTWVRGLKLYMYNLVLSVCASHPTWVRGLKPTYFRYSAWYILVAPYVGAWIETKPKASKSGLGKVAPYVGAWIETS